MTGPRTWVRRLFRPSTDHLVRMTTVVVALLVVLAVATLWRTSQGKAGIDAQNRSDEIAACRSEFRAGIDVANVVADRAESLRVDAIADVLTASINRDKPAVAAAGLRLEASRKQIREARVGVERATKVYAGAVKLPPEELLDLCRTR